MMVVGKEDLGLTLSLSCSNNTTNTPNTSHHGNNRNMNMNSNGNNNNNNNNNNNQMGFLMMMNKNTPQTTPFSPTNSSTPLQLNLMMNPTINISSNSTPPITTTTPATTSNSFLHKLQRHPSTDSFPPSDRLFLRGIDVNRPSVGGGGGGGGEEEDAGVSSPNSTVSTVSGKRSRDSTTAAGGGAGDEIDTERTSSRGGMSDDEDGGENSRKKLRLTKDQSATLEETFKEHNTLNPKQKLALAKRLGLRPRQVEVWFQNRRARTKLKQTEVDCEFLKRCCEQLTEENRRLQKEVQELRTLKMSPQFYMQMTPPTTLTMCPSCERVAVPPGGGGGPDSRRPLPVNPWAVKAPTPIRSFDGVNTRTLV